MLISVQVRTTGLGVASSFAKFAGILTPFVANLLLDFELFVPIVIYSRLFDVLHFSPFSACVCLQVWLASSYLLKHEIVHWKTLFRSNQSKATLLRIFMECEIPVKFRIFSCFFLV